MRFIAGTTLAMLIASAPLWASGGGSMGGGSMGGGGSMESDSGDAQPRSPDILAKGSYNRGVKEVDKGKKAEAEAAAATDPARKQKALASAQKNFDKARGYFTDAVNNRSDMYQAWNYLGFTQRKLGNFEAALAAYDQALTYSPAYGEAIEYRAEAYLALNRLDDAKSAYMTLFRDARPLAAQLMTTMQKWVESRKQDGKGPSPEDLDAFAKWVDERAAISEKAALLGASDPAASSWN
jgi:tetratricopeptide (TPR) repeat protein